jgi:hypothetical protein
MRTILLHNTKRFAVVDDADFEALSRHAWKLTTSGGARRAYAYRTDGGKVVLMHHDVAGRPAAGLVVAHVDGDGLNNTRGNLRFVTHAQNRANAVKKAGGSSSRFKGVRRAGSRWQAGITAGGVFKNLGLHDTEEAAARAYDEAARRLHGACAALNFPLPGERSAVAA